MKEINFNIPFIPTKSERQIEEIRQRVKNNWLTQSEETRRRRLDRTYTEEDLQARREAIKPGEGINSPEKVAKRKQTKISNGSNKSPEYWQEIYDLFWGEDRNSKKLKDKVCKEYGVKPGTLHSLINGCPEMNLPQETKDTHEQRLRNWHKQWGDYRYIYSINDNQFDSLAEAGKWFITENNLPEPVTKDGKVNYGNVVWGYFKMCEKTPILKKGKYKGWKFIKRERYSKKEKIL